MFIEKQIEARHFAEVPIDITETDVKTTFDAFDAFLSLPLEYRTAGDYQLPDKSTASFGYRRRVAGKTEQGRDVSTDTKHVYHFGTGSRQKFEGNGWRRTPKDVQRFCDVAEHLFWLSTSTLRQTLYSLRQDYYANRGIYDPKVAPNIWPLLFDNSQPLDFHLRFNGYELSDPVQEYLGHRHTDRAGLVLAPISSPGIEFGAKEDGSDAKPANPTPGMAQFFAGGGWNNFPEEVRSAYPALHPAVHAVRRTERDHISQSRKIVGHSVVLFANPRELDTDLPFSQTKPLAPSRNQEKVIQSM